MNPFDWAKDLVGGVAKDAALAPLSAMASGVADAVGTMLATLATLWLRLDVPNVWNGSTSPVVQTIHSDLAPFVALVAVLGIIIGAIRLAWEQHSQPAFDLVQGLITLVLVTGMGVPVIGLLTSGSDAWAEGMIKEATGKDFGHNLMTLIAPSGPLAPVLVVFFGVVALLVSVAQIMILAFRAVALVLMAGLLPISAAFTTTAAGKQHFRRVVAWIIALTFYKPLAALIYVTAFRLAGSNTLTGSGVSAMLIGLTMMVIAVVALPALLRLLVPAIGALGTGRSSPMTSTLPKGARMVKGLL